MRACLLLVIAILAGCAAAPAPHVAAKPVIVVYSFCDNIKQIVVPEADGTYETYSNEQLKKDASPLEGRHFVVMNYCPT